MRSLLTISLLSLANTLFAEFEKGVIYTSNHDSIECLIEVYQPGVLVGNTGTLSCIAGTDTSKMSLKNVSSLRLGEDTYHVLTLKELGEGFFDEEVIIEHQVIAKLIQEGKVNLYQYYYSGNSIYSNGKPIKAFGKSLHERPIIRSKDKTVVVYKMTYASCIRRFFPMNGKEILSGGFKYDNISAAVIEGNKYLAQRN